MRRIINTPMNWMKLSGQGLRWRQSYATSSHVELEGWYHTLGILKAMIHHIGNEYISFLIIGTRTRIAIKFQSRSYQFYYPLDLWIYSQWRTTRNTTTIYPNLTRVLEIPLINIIAVVTHVDEKNTTHGTVLYACPKPK